MGGKKGPELLFLPHSLQVQNDSSRVGAIGEVVCTVKMESTTWGNMRGHDEGGVKRKEMLGQLI